MYTRFKKLLPQKLRLKLKPFYEKFFTKDFRAETTVTVKEGSASFNINLDPKNGAVDKYIYIHKNWEPHIGKVLREIILPGQTVMDVGANIGYFSLLATKLVGDEGKVYAVEPIPKLTDQIERSCKSNNFTNLQVFKTAVSNKEGRLLLNIPKENIGGSSLVVENREGEHLNVPVSTIDCLCKNFMSLNLIKIDVEGHEFAAFQGGEKTIKKFKPKIIFEYSPQMYKNQPGDVAVELVQFLVDCGYYFKVLQTGKEYTDATALVSDVALKQVDVLAVAV